MGVTQVTSDDSAMPAPPVRPQDGWEGVGDAGTSVRVNEFRTRIGTDEVVGVYGVGEFSPR